MTNNLQHIEAVYDNVEINITSGSGAQRLSTLGTTFKKNLNSSNGIFADPTSVVIRTNQTISVQLNSASNDLITISATDSPYSIESIRIFDMWITNNSGSTAAVRMFFQPTKF